MSVILGPDGQPIHAGLPELHLPNRAARRAALHGGTRQMHTRLQRRLAETRLQLARAWQARVQQLAPACAWAERLAHQVACAQQHDVDAPYPVPPPVDHPWSPEQIAAVARSSTR